MPAFPAFWADPVYTEEKVDVLLEAMDQAPTYAQLRAVIREALS